VISGRHCFWHALFQAVLACDVESCPKSYILLQQEEEEARAPDPPPQDSDTQKVKMVPRNSKKFKVKMCAMNGVRFLMVLYSN